MLAFISSVTAESANEAVIGLSLDLSLWTSIALFFCCCITHYKWPLQRCQIHSLKGATSSSICSVITFFHLSVWHAESFLSRFTWKSICACVICCLDDIVYWVLNRLPDMELFYLSQTLKAPLHRSSMSMLQYEFTIWCPKQVYHPSLVTQMKKRVPKIK